MENLIHLFLLFLKVNLLSTSGPASVGLLYHEVVGKSITEAQFVQAVGFSAVLPGSDALQLAMYIGYAMGGIPGGLVALVASILPPTVIILGVTAILHRLRREGWI
ncbi:MAG TPA: chromate transporter, partial [Anaerolineales bacterium]|nr:chromate transporter [Anaerolineales bacterium]